MESQRLTVQEAAGKWGVSTRSVFRYIEQGRIKGYRIGKLTYVDDEMPVTPKIAVVTNQDRGNPDTTLARTTPVDVIGEIIIGEYKSAKKRQFRANIALVACLVTMGIMGSGFYFVWMMYQGQGRELANTKSLLSETRQQLQDKDQRIDDLADEVIRSLKDRQPEPQPDRTEPQAPEPTEFSI